MLLALFLACSEIPKEEQKQIQTEREIFVSQLAKNINDEQQKVAYIIEKNFNNMQIPKNITAAAIVNAVAESKLCPYAVGDNGKAIGVFQLHTNGLGNKISPLLRKDVNINSNVIAVQIIKNDKLLNKEKNGAAISELTKIITKDIMRPDDVQAQMIQREHLAKRMFPDRIWYERF